MVKFDWFVHEVSDFYFAISLVAIRKWNNVESSTMTHRVMLKMLKQAFHQVGSLPMR